MIKAFNFKEVRNIFLLFAVIAILSGCKDDPSLVGGSIMPEDDAIQGESISVHGLSAVNVKRDFVASDQASYAILGEFNDPVFGFSKSGFVTQINNGVLLDTTRFAIDATYHLDGMELHLAHAVNDWYGDDSTAVHKLSVYGLTQPLQNDLTTYYSNNEMSGKYDPSLLGSYSLKANNISDSAWRAANYVDTIKIKITNSDLANRFFNELDRTTLSDNNWFKGSFFNGIYVKSEFESGSSVGSLIRFKVWGYNLGLKMYYHRKGTVGADTATKHFSHLFPISSEGVDFNIFEHNPSSEISFGANPDYLYLQGMSGCYPNIALPDTIFEFSKLIGKVDDGSTYRFSSVTLEMFVDTLKSEISKYPLPRTLRLYRRNPLTGELEIPFYNAVDTTSSTGYTRVNGVSDAVYNSEDRSYRFYVSNEFFRRVVTKDDKLPSGQRLGNGLDDVTNFQSLFVTPINTSQSFQRVVFYGANNKDKTGIVFKVRRVKYK